MNPVATPQEALRAAAALLHKKGWCQHKMRDHKGRHCVIGALTEVTKDVTVFTGAVDLLLNVLPYHTPVVAFNDTRGRKLEDILAVLEKAQG